MLSTFTASVRDGLSNLAASLGAGRDKAASDAFVLRDLSRAEVEAMYRGDWLARKVVDIVPSDMCREWRTWSGERADVARMEAAERRLGLRRAVQRAMVLGRLAEDGTYPNARVVFGEGAGVGDGRTTIDTLGSGVGLYHYLTEPRDWHGRWAVQQEFASGASGTKLLQPIGIIEDLEHAGGGAPSVHFTPKGARQFVFPNGMILRFDLEPRQYLAPRQGPHINLEEPNGGPNYHIPLRGSPGGGTLNIIGPHGGGGGRIPPNELLEE